MPTTDFQALNESDEIENSMSFGMIYENDETDLEILKKICRERKSEEPLYLLDIGDIVKKHLQWLKKLPRVVPYYAVKCNPDTMVIRTIAALNGNFDCASKQEIDLVLSHGVESDRIIYANPVRFRAHLEHARDVNISFLTVDSEGELKKIKEIHPQAKILIRIRCDATVTTASLGEKYGCDPKSLAPKLIRTTIQLGLNLVGFCFHVGSPCGEPMAYHRGIKLCQGLINLAKLMGCEHVNLIDIGGGISGERSADLDVFADVINEALEDVDPSIKIIAEPGRYYVSSAFSTAATIVCKKSLIVDGEKSFMYYLSDGCYNSFLEHMMHVEERYPVSVNNTESQNAKKYKSSLWGPTCDSFDVILKNKLVPEYNEGDWLVWFNMGAYTSSLSTNFNGFQYSNCYPIIRLNDYNTLMETIGSERSMRMKMVDLSDQQQKCAITNLHVGD